MDIKILGYVSLAQAVQMERRRSIPYLRVCGAKHRIGSKAFELCRQRKGKG